MMLSHITLENPIVFRDGEINVLVVENEKQMTSYVQELISQINGQHGNFILSDGNVNIDLLLAQMILDPFSIDVNERTILNKLYSELKRESYESENYLLTNEVISTVEKFVLSISEKNQFQLIHSEEIDISGIFKLVDLKFEKPTILLENICDYLFICSKYRRTLFFFILNINCFLSEEESELFYDFILYNKINVLLIESNATRRSKRENVRIIDKDLCEISNYEQSFY